METNDTIDISVVKSISTVAEALAILAIGLGVNLAVLY